MPTSISGIDRGTLGNLRGVRENRIEDARCNLGSLKATDVGFIRADESGCLVEWSPGIARVLSEGGSQPHQPASLDAWARLIPVDGRAALGALLTHGETGDNIQVAVGDAPRWYEMRRLPESMAGHVDLLVVEQTARVEQIRLAQLMLRHQQVVTETVEALASTVTVEETTAEILASLGQHLELREACWHHLEASGWHPLAKWRHADLDSNAQTTFDPEAWSHRLTGGLPAIAAEENGKTLLVPILLHGDLQHVLILTTLREQTWEPPIIDLVMRVADAIGRRLEAQIAEAERESWAAERGALEKSEAIAQLTSGVAHDFNGVLFAILGRFELLRLHSDDPKVLGEVDEIERTVQEAKRLADRLRRSLKGDDEVVLEMHVQPELGAVAATIGRLLPNRIEFAAALKLPETPIRIKSRRDTLQQILLNLAVNARNAVGSKGRIQLGARLLPDGRLEIRIDDDGPGIPAEERARCLEPYETGEDSDGVGLGLSICRRLAEDLGGEILLDDSPLGGLAARFLLPIEGAEDESSPAPTTAASADPREVVVIEDNHIIRDVLVRVYEGLGATVHALPHSMELERVLAENDGIDLLVIDIDLPHRTGIEALETIRGLGIEIPCLLVTGGLAEQPDCSRTGFLRKPFKIDVLRQASRRLLSERR